MGVFLCAGVTFSAMAGCGSNHQGGPIDVSENPYQVSEAEQARMNASNRVPDEVIEQASDDSGVDTDASLETQPTPTGDGGDSYDPQ
ncbi:MAG: hypothetical protein AAFV88_08880 [Planctomycetota bacterium]